LIDDVLFYQLHALLLAQTFLFVNPCSQNV
jgi:hypothetical protein